MTGRSLEKQGLHLQAQALFLEGNNTAAAKLLLPMIQQETPETSSKGRVALLLACIGDNDPLSKAILARYPLKDQATLHDMRSKWRIHPERRKKAPASNGLGDTLGEMAERGATPVSGADARKAGLFRTNAPDLTA